MINSDSLSGLYFSVSRRKSEYLYALSRRKQPDRTVLAVNFFRMQKSADLFWPDGYTGKRELPVMPSQVAETDAELFEQRPAPYRFVPHNGKLEAQPQRNVPFDPLTAEQMRRVIQDKLLLVSEVLQGNHADPLVLAAIKAFSECIVDPVEQTQTGVLLMRFRSIEAHASAYTDAASESDRTVRAVLDDLARSADDFLALFPSVRQIEAYRHALAFEGNNQAIKNFQEFTSEISNIASSSNVVGDSVLKALEDGSTQINELSQRIVTSSSEKVRAQAIQARAAVAGLQALDVRNVSSAAMSWLYEEMKTVAGDSWDEAKRVIPQAVGHNVQHTINVGLRIGIILLVAHIAGPLGVLAVVAPTFAPLAKKAEEVAKLVSGDSEGDIDGEEKS